MKTGAGVRSQGSGVSGASSIAIAERALGRQAARLAIEREMRLRERLAEDARVRRRMVRAMVRACRRRPGPAEIAITALLALGALGSLTFLLRVLFGK